MSLGLPALTSEQAQRRARIRNQNAAKRAPLFAAAGLLPQVTPADVLAQHEDFVQHWREREQRDAAKTAAIRALLVQIVGDETVLQWDAYAARVYPPQSEYVRGYYRMQYRKSRGCAAHCYQCRDACPLELEMKGEKSG
jgi:hypothetical protein